MVGIGVYIVNCWLTSLCYDMLVRHRHGMILNEPVIKGTIRSFVEVGSYATEQLTQVDDWI